MSGDDGVRTGRLHEGGAEQPGHFLVELVRDEAPDVVGPARLLLQGQRSRRAAVLWQDGAYAQRLRERAADLRRRFTADFWMTGADFPALALDGRGRQVDALASDAGHLLWSGILEPEAARRVGRRLMEPDFFSGWAIRTLAAGQKPYHPLSYHRGSAWPHDNAVIALGLARHGLADEVHTPTRAPPRPGQRPHPWPCGRHWSPSDVGPLGLTTDDTPPRVRRPGPTCRGMRGPVAFKRTTDAPPRGRSDSALWNPRPPRRRGSVPGKGARTGEAPPEWGILPPSGRHRRRQGAVHCGTEPSGVSGGRALTSRLPCSASTSAAPASTPSSAAAARSDGDL